MTDQISRRTWMASIVAAAGVTEAMAQADWQPAFLTSTENDALIALGDRIIPGSSAAQSNRVIDLLLSIESPAAQTGFRHALKAFMDAGFQKLTATEQDVLLTRASTAGDSLEHSFLYLKEWLADSYWTSKPGLKELGFSGQMAWRDFQPCPHPPA